MPPNTQEIISRLGEGIRWSMIPETRNIEEPMTLPATNKVAPMWRSKSMRGAGPDTAIPASAGLSSPNVRIPMNPPVYKLLMI
jgi:hypothetical protein